MYPQSLTLTNFRNYEHLQFEFPSNVLMLVGKNGSGKTNFLEALSFIGSTRSFRTKHHFDVVRWGEDTGAISVQFPEGSSVSHLGIFLDRRKKVRQFRKNRSAVTILDFLGEFPVVFFAPDDVLMVSGAPRLRRQFLDLALSQCDGQYFRTVTEYQRVLRHRNTLLLGVRDGMTTLEELPFWDERLCSLGAQIMTSRMELLREIHQTLSEYYSLLSDESSHCFLEYRPSFSFPHEHHITSEALEPALFERILSERSREIRYGRTLIGPHLDDLRFYLNDHPLADFGSRGEVRSAMLALRMAQRDVFSQRLQAQPVMLFDDVFSELDRGRRQRLLHTVARNLAVFTSTDIDGVHDLPSETAVISVQGGILNVH